MPRAPCSPEGGLSELTFAHGPPGTRGSWSDFGGDILPGEPGPGERHKLAVLRGWRWERVYMGALLSARGDQRTRGTPCPRKAAWFLSPSCAKGSTAHVPCRNSHTPQHCLERGALLHPGLQDPLEVPAAPELHPTRGSLHRGHFEAS